MSDRKYRQRGYQDEAGPAPNRADRGQRRRDVGGPPRPSLPAFRERARCARCGRLLTSPVAPDSQCDGCRADLHACVQCIHFDPGRTFECRRPIKTRISPKDVRNDCGDFAVKVVVERETGSQGPSNARQAFDDLFK